LPNGQLKPTQNEIHVWRVMLEEVSLPWAENFLSAEEHIYSSNFRLASPRAEFVRTRAAVRHVCADCLECEPSAVRFDKNEFGKLNISGFDLSVSHSSGVALIAIAPCAVGIDLELIDNNFDWRSVADRFFTPVELHFILRSEDRDQLETFLQCWTRREAFVKARGTGDPTDAPELLSNRIFHGGSTWSIENPSIVPGFVCCVVNEGEPLPIRVREWRSQPIQNEKKAATSLLRDSGLAFSSGVSFF
jgi:4'-phosphopantetheinyl transferase